MDRIDENLERIWRTVRLGETQSVSLEPGTVEKPREVTVASNVPLPSSAVLSEVSNSSNGQVVLATKQPADRPALFQMNEGERQDQGTIQSVNSTQTGFQPNRIEQCRFDAALEDVAKTNSSAANGQRPLIPEQKKVSFFRRVLKRLGF